jgi:hypothetical protein
MMKISEALERALALIDTPEKWTKNAQARTKRGCATYASSMKAYSFCAIGAICRVCADNDVHVFLEKILTERGYVYDGDPLMSFNDNPDTNHLGVVWLFKEGIEKARAQETAT